MLPTLLSADWETRVDLLATPDLEERSLKVRDLLHSLLASKGVHPPALEVAPTSKALIRRPAQSAHTDIPQLPDDLQPLLETFRQRSSTPSGSGLSPDVTTALTRELTRLAKIPPQSAEYGVGKTYIEWLLALPWKRVSETGKEVDLVEAKRRLDADHEGLEGVKRRVVEYLAVYR